MHPTARVSWSQALAWRLERQLLAGTGGGSVADVVRRLAAVQTQVASSAELAIRLRRESSHPGDVARALASGAVLKTWAMRGALHLLTPQGAAFLSLMASGKFVGTTELGEILRDDPGSTRTHAGGRARRA